MDNFVLYEVKAGAQWFRCMRCFNLTRGKPNVCPVCYNKGRLAQIMQEQPPPEQSTDVIFDHIKQQYKDIFEKYDKE